MTRAQNNKLRMFKATYEILNNNSIAVSTIPAFTVSIDALSRTIAGIEQKERDRSRALDGKSEQKDLAIEALVKVVVAVASALFLLGRERKDTALTASMALKDSDFRLMRDAERDRLSKEILEKASQEKDSIVKYGASPALLERLQIVRQEYSNAIAASSTSIPSRSTAGTMLEEYFDQGDDLLKNELDRYALIARSDHPEFYKKYQAARIIKDLSTRRSDKTQSETAPTETPSGQSSA